MPFEINKRRMAKNTIALYVRMAITMAIGFFTARVTLQQLGVEDYGLNNLVGSIVSMFSFINGSMGTAVQRFYSYEIGKGNEGRLKRVFSTGLYLHIIVAIITLLIAEIFAIFFLKKMNIPEERMLAAQIVFQVSVLSLILNIVNVPYAALLRAREMFDKTAMIEIVQAFLRLGILYMLTIINYDKLIVYSILGFCVTLFYVGSLTYLAYRFDETHCKPLRDKELIREMLMFISMLLMTVLCQLLSVQGMVILINLFFGLVINAAYAIAVQVSNLVNTFVASFKQSMVPQLMSSYGAKDYSAMHKIIDIGTKFSYLLLLMITMPVIFEIDALLSLWLGTPPQYASKLVILALININISSFTYFHYQGVHASGNIRNQQIWMSSLYVLNILLIYIVFKIGASFEVALYINMLVSLIQCVVNLIYAKKTFEYRISPFVKGILAPSFLLTLIVCIIDYSLVHFMGPTLWRFVIVFLVSELLICSLGYSIVLNKTEREKIKIMLFSKISTIFPSVNR